MSGQRRHDIMLDGGGVVQEYNQEWARLQERGKPPRRRAPSCQAMIGPTVVEIMWIPPVPRATATVMATIRAMTARMPPAGPCSPWDPVESMAPGLPWMNLVVPSLAGFGLGSAGRRHCGVLGLERPRAVLATFGGQPDQPPAGGSSPRRPPPPSVGVATVTTSVPIRATALSYVGMRTTSAKHHHDGRQVPLRESSSPNQLNRVPPTDFKLNMSRYVDTTEPVEAIPFGGGPGPATRGGAPAGRGRGQDGRALGGDEAYPATLAFYGHKIL